MKVNNGINLKNNGDDDDDDGIPPFIPLVDMLIFDIIYQLYYYCTLAFEIKYCYFISRVQDPGRKTFVFEVLLIHRGSPDANPYNCIIHNCIIVYNCNE